MICCWADSTSLIFTGPSGLNIVFHHFDAARGHGGVKVIPEFGAGTFQRDRQHLRSTRARISFS